MAEMMATDIERQIRNKAFIPSSWKCQHKVVELDDVLVCVRQAEATRTKQLQKLFDFVLAQDKDWRHSYELLGHSYEIYLAECIGFMDELKKKFKGLLKP